MNLWELGYLLGGAVIGFAVHRIINEILYRKIMKGGGGLMIRNLWYLLTGEIEKIILDLDTQKESPSDC